MKNLSIEQIDSLQKRKEKHINTISYFPSEDLVFLKPKLYVMKFLKSHLAIADSLVFSEALPCNSRSREQRGVEDHAGMPRHVDVSRRFEKSTF